MPERAYGDSAAARRGVQCECGHATSDHEGDEYGFCLACDCNHYRPVIKTVGGVDETADPHAGGLWSNELERRTRQVAPGEWS